MEQQNIGAYIARKRKEKNLTQAQFAELVNVSNKTVSKWETGKCMPDYSTIDSVCKALDITIAELIDGEDKSEKSIRVYDEDHIKELLKKVERFERTEYTVYACILFIMSSLMELIGNSFISMGGKYVFYGNLHYVLDFVLLIASCYVLIREKVYNKRKKIK